MIEVGSNYVMEDVMNKVMKDYQYEYGTDDKGTCLVGGKPISADPNLNQTNGWGQDWIFLELYNLMECPVHTQLQKITCRIFITPKQYLPTILQ